MPDRIYIEENHRNIIKDIDDVFNGPNRFERIDLFLMALALGLNSRKELTGKKEGFVRLQTLKENQTNLIYVCAWHHLKLIDKLFDEELVYRVAEECANSGFILLGAIFKDHSKDFIKKLMHNTLNKVS